MKGLQSILHPLCVATKILNLKAIPSIQFGIASELVAVRCNKNTKSESYSQWLLSGSLLKLRCALQQKY